MLGHIKLVLVLVFAFSLGVVVPGHCADCTPSRPCIPDRPVPPESIGCLGVPFDIPIWPTILKTEFHILPWISLNKMSVCLPGKCKAVEFRVPCLSLRPIPVWLPWLRPLDAECKNSEPCAVP
ncbi:MAG: hypothetical protein ACP5U1_11010 [Desulfomonilaceae bacterium]